MDLKTLQELAPTLAERHGATAAAWISQAAVERVRDRLGHRLRGVEAVLARAYAVLLEAALTAAPESIDRDALLALLRDEAVAGELLRAVAEPGGRAPDAAILREACPEADAAAIDWPRVAADFQQRVEAGEVGRENGRELLDEEGWRAWSRGQRSSTAPERRVRFDDMIPQYGDISDVPSGEEEDAGELMLPRGPSPAPPAGAPSGGGWSRGDSSREESAREAPPREEAAWKEAPAEESAPPSVDAPAAAGPPGHRFGMAPPVASSPPDPLEAKDVSDEEAAEDQAGESPARKPLRRTPHMDLSPEPPFAPGNRFTVEVYVDRQAMRTGESGRDVVIDAAADQASFDLEVWLVASADHFTVAEDVQPLRIERDRAKSSVATFSVEVRAEAGTAEPAFLSAVFSYEGRPCGRVSRTVALRVEPAAGEAEPAGSGGDARRGGANLPGFAAAPSPAAAAPEPVGAATPEVAASDAPAPEAAAAAKPPERVEIVPGVAADLVVRVAKVSNDGRRFTCRVTTPLLAGYEAGRTGDWELPESTERWVGNVMADFTSSGLSPKMRRAALVGAGESLFEAAPEIFREAFWRLVDDAGALTRLKTIALVSDEPYVPWELMVPTRPRPGAVDEERPPLGVEFVVARWTARDGVAPPQELALTDSYVVAPTDSGLKNAAAEASLVAGEFSGLLVDPASMETLDDLLAGGGRSLLHFICHGLSENGQQTLVLQGKEKMRPYFLRGLPNVETALRASRPLVFLNACEVGRLVPDLVGAGGFAEAFMNLGAGGVVAALWSVKDDLAHELAEEFYRRVREEPETPYAAILRDLRSRSYTDAAAEDTWAAYCFYGDPLAATTSSRSTRV